MLYDELISIYKKYNQFFMSKNEDQRPKDDYKNLRDLDYEADETDEEHEADE